jgi:hypothetical protein
MGEVETQLQADSLPPEKRDLKKKLGDSPQQDSHGQSHNRFAQLGREQESASDDREI